MRNVIERYNNNKTQRQNAGLADKNLESQHRDAVALASSLGSISLPAAPVAFEEGSRTWRSYEAGNSKPGECTLLHYAYSDFPFLLDQDKTC